MGVEPKLRAPQARVLPLHHSHHALASLAEKWPKGQFLTAFAHEAQEIFRPFNHQHIEEEPEDNEGNPTERERGNIEEISHGRHGHG